MEKSGLKVYWTDTAKADLRTIFDFFADISVELAERMASRIYAEAGILGEGQPHFGPLEPLLEEYPEEFRFLLQGNYKIIYHVDGESAFIDAVFDTRMEPRKLSDKFPNQPE